MVKLFYGEESREINFETPYIKIDAPYAKLYVYVEKQNIHTIKSNNKKLNLTEGQNEFDILPNAYGINRLQIDGEQKFESVIEFSCVKEVSLKEKENLLHFITSIKNVLENNNTISIQSLLDALEGNKINIFSLAKPLTGFDDSKLKEKLKGELNFKIKDICSHPKQGTKIEEIVQDVNLVKKINYKTLRNLASHTEHWKSRTLDGIVPNRLVSEIIEDEIDIYENLFFKKAIDTISRFVNDQIKHLNKAGKQNSTIINWENYGSQFQDLSRNIIINKVLNKSNDSLAADNDIYNKEIEKWKEISKILTSIKASSFYNRISKNKIIDDNIKITNILKYDQRYKTLYDLYKEVNKERQKEISEGASTKIIDDVYKAYQAYVLTCLIYAFNLLEINFSKNSFLSLDEEYNLDFDIQAADGLFEYNIKRIGERINMEIKIDFKEKLEFPYVVPENLNLLEKLDKLQNCKNFARYDETKRILYLLKKPDSLEQSLLLNVFKEKRDYNKNKQEKINDSIKMEEWGRFINKIIVDNRLKNPEIFSITLKPIYGELIDSSEKILSITDKLFHSFNKSTIICMPNHLEDYKNLNSYAVARRLINYGEAFTSIDDKKYKNYNMGILSIEQSDFFTIQRFIKLITLSRARFIITNEKGNEKHCPLCGGMDIFKIDQNTFECRSVVGAGLHKRQCHAVWGQTHCVAGCGEYFNWIKPNKKIKIQSILEGGFLQNILQKENIFDRYIITDFEIVNNEDVYPTCPKCGIKRGEKI